MDIIFNMHKVRFAILDELIRQNNITFKNNKVNFFINLEPILYRLTNKRIDEYLRLNNESKVFQIISNIFNLVAHYRLYFASRRIDSKIYVYIQYPFNSKMNNAKYNKEYRRMYTFRYVDNINNYIICENMNTALPLCRILLEYINGCYLITSGSIENSIIPSMLNINDRTNMILSKDIYDMQYIKDDYKILYPKQDESFILTDNNFAKSFERIYSVGLGELTIKQLSFIISIMGNDKRNIYGIKGMGMKRAISMLQSAIKNNIITPNTDNVNILLRSVKNEYRDIIETNIHCTDIGLQYDDLSVKDFYNIKEQLVDKFDNDALKDLQYRYFQDYPLMLDEITLIPKERTNVIF